ncbi:ubiquinone biosynthesis protein Coq4 [Schizosaccharomyces japonicus yFS275]|uniref:Ubiquinone biosynthesis protein coq4, mitochondrial n=1 Tax=Schizosaccharomyces japonicus (strain yFS275 / FY16936) TaxID=402676 RepID=COQ4_SCHJY|nr:ubiquinone biosynthesis protein Coq4 [Schizosaccharomyces japonicus yFS275]B6JWE5.1 RecName: Full=Ubiquinone biosynthesis protein coq4, mitochondrial; AltName: Full=Coenzyme Q biosynthesis protein 4 [Schizosaccharomyces japonicus yFS275]EEB05696.1 ubiquinone biosynthesis protein Coq4 [Schizosaccharomyces japonicus yFS275]
MFFPNARPVNYPGHIPLSPLQRMFLVAGSAIMGLKAPWRGDMIAVLGDASGQPFFLRRLRDKMLANETGRRILKEQPRMTSKSLNLPHLRTLPPNTLGRIYVDWIDKEHVTPDSRAPTRYVDDPEEAYVMQRYRECHDFFHAVSQMPTNIEGELAIKWLEFINMGLPVGALSALFGPLRLNRVQASRFRRTYVPWAIRNGLKAELLVNVYWEKELENDVDEVRQHIRLQQAPALSPNTP